MPSVRSLRQRLTSYADREPWKRAHDEAQACFKVEERMAWGVQIFRGLLELESQAQKRALINLDAETEQLSELLPLMYRLWLDASEFYLDRAKSFVQADYSVDGMDAFEATFEEARCLLDNLSIEDQMRPIGELLSLVRPDNPRPDRYID